MYGPPSSSRPQLAVQTGRSRIVYIQSRLSNYVPHVLPQVLVSLCPRLLCPHLCVFSFCISPSPTSLAELNERETPDYSFRSPATTTPRKGKVKVTVFATLISYHSFFTKLFTPAIRPGFHSHIVTYTCSVAGPATHSTSLEFPPRLFPSWDTDFYRFSLIILFWFTSCLHFSCTPFRYVPLLVLCISSKGPIQTYFHRASFTGTSFGQSRGYNFPFFFVFGPRPEEEGELIYLGRVQPHHSRDSALGAARQTTAKF